MSASAAAAAEASAAPAPPVLVRVVLSAAFMGALGIDAVSLTGWLAATEGCLTDEIACPGLLQVFKMTCSFVVAAVSHCNFCFSFVF